MKPLIPPLIPPALVLGCNTPLGVGVLSDWLEEQTGTAPEFVDTGWSDDYVDGHGAGNGYGRIQRDGSASGDGDGMDYGYGWINGDGRGKGDANGYRKSDGSCFYSSDGYGQSSGDGTGSGFGSNIGDGHIDGDRDGYNG